MSKHEKIFNIIFDRLIYGHHCPTESLKSLLFNKTLRKAFLLLLLIQFIHFRFKYILFNIHRIVLFFIHSSISQKPIKRMLVYKLKRTQNIKIQKQQNRNHKKQWKYRKFKNNICLPCCKVLKMLFFGYYQFFFLNP